MLLKGIAKQLLFISWIPKLHAILQLVSAPLNPERNSNKMNEEYRGYTVQSLLKEN